MPVADEIISQVFDVVESDERQEMAHTPEFLVIKCRDALGPLDLRISTNAAPKLAEVLVKHLQARDSP